MNNYNKTNRVCNSYRTDPFKDSFENLALELAQHTQEFYDLRRMAKKHNYPINNKGEFVT